MAQGGEENVFYAFFTCKCRGIKFYDLVNVELEFWHSVSFQREPENPHDCNAVLVYTITEDKRKLMLALAYPPTSRSLRANAQLAIIYL